MLAVVGAFITLIAFLQVFSLPVDLVIVLVGSIAWIHGVFQLFARLSPSQSRVLAYFTGGNPEGIPRWVYAGLVVGILAFAGNVILYYYGFYLPYGSARDFEFYTAAVLFVLGGQTLWYPMVFLKGYWREA